MPGHRGKFAQKAIGESTCYRQLSVALEFRDRHTRGFVENTRRFDLAITVLGEHALHGYDTRAPSDGRCGSRSDEIGDRIVAPHRRHLRRPQTRSRARGDRLWTLLRPSDRRDGANVGW